MEEKPYLYVQKMAEIGKAPTSSGRSRVFGKISFNELSLATAQVNKRPVEYFHNEDFIKTEYVIGKNSKKPVTIDGPAVVAAMSFGALSKPSKIAIAKGAAMANTADNTGEGGMLHEQRLAAKVLIAQYSTGRFGVDEEYLGKADVIEIKYGQGAKPGQGGLLPADKVTEEIAKIRSSKTKKINPRESVHSPAAHPDIFSIADLKKKIKWLRDLTAGKPIILKIAACDIEKDLPLAIQAGSDVIAIDGSEGGTGAAPGVMLHNTGMPTVAALVEARYIMDKLKAKQDLWFGGGIYTGADMAKALALGADMIFTGTALMHAMGCINCGTCHLGKCPRGIATQDPELSSKLNIEEAAKRVSNYFKAARSEVKMLAAACGHSSVYELNKDDLMPLTREMADITGMPLIGMERAKKLFRDK
jgi:glutamate synthase domain-containing protein 2